MTAFCLYICIQTDSRMKDKTNPLLIPWSTPFGVAPFGSVKAEHFKPATEHAVDVALREINKIVSGSEEPDFGNTVVALEDAGELLNRITPVLFNLNSADTTPELQAAAQQVSPILTNFANDITLNPELFRKVKAVYDKKETLGLDPEQMILLDRKYKGFVRGGAALPEADKEEFRAITVEMSTLSLHFEENLLAETNDFTMHLTDATDLVGLPDNVQDAAAIAAKEKGLEGWLFTLHD